MKIAITITCESAKPVKVKIEQTEEEVIQEYGQYARLVDAPNLAWCKDQENYANEKLMTRGYLFLNEVYSMLGLPCTPAGQVIGWIYDATNPTEGKLVDFGLTKSHVSKFLNGYAKSVLLDFNVHGLILDQLDME